MKVTVTFDFDLRCRRALGDQLGAASGTLDHNGLKRWCEMTVNAALESIMADYDKAQADATKTA
jgi:hypothetical protein